MNVLLPPQPQFRPRQHNTTRLSPSQNSSAYTMPPRKRKAEDDFDEMSVSPVGSPSISSRHVARSAKKSRATHDLTGRPLLLPRLLETLDNSQLRAVLQTICERHPAIGHEVVTGAPRPTVERAIEVLREYQQRLRQAVPYGESSSEYTYYRVKSQLVALVDAISDFTPQFLPPTEQQITLSLQYLDSATKIVHELPDWDGQQYRHHKDNAYDEISQAWALVISEASKRGGGFTLHTGGWDQILTKHHQQSGGRLEHAINAMVTSVGWAGQNSGNGAGSNQGQEQQASILDQILSGAYNSPVRVGPW